MLKLTMLMVVLIAAACCGASEITPRVSPFEESLQFSSFEMDQLIADADEIAVQPAAGSSAQAKTKSPTKAFLMSLAVPGAGQLYNGSKVKAGSFFAVEAASWLFHVKYHNDGEDATDAFQAFSAAHWSQTSYENYLKAAYANDYPALLTTPDDDLLHEPEVSHHLPDTKTQQYYEMTGKYNQFAWGWDDATRHGMDLNAADSFYSDSGLRIANDTAAPTSANRSTYNKMRANANSKYDKARSFLFAVMANHIASAFEALISSKKLNKKLAPATGVLGNVKMKASLKSYYAKRDTPYVTLSYKFY